MKNFYLFISLLIFLVSCSSGGGEQPEIFGCMDDCATNYNPDATSDVGQVCLYSFVGTYTVSEYKEDGVSLFDANVWANPMVAGAISFGLSDDGTVGVWGSAYILADGTELGGSGTFVNSETQLMLYHTDGSPVTLWTTTKINCLEFDGNTMIDGYFYEIELDWYSARLDNLENNSNLTKFDITKLKRK
tara:strand:+ start:154 stop:720 length:567 start_codon:yes stop_codon:yes gene_type:complete